MFGVIIVPSGNKQLPEPMLTYHNLMIQMSVSVWFTKAIT